MNWNCLKCKTLKSKVDAGAIIGGCPKGYIDGVMAAGVFDVKLSAEVHAAVGFCREAVLELILGVELGAIGRIAED